jgi:hypothetical protein
VKGIVVGPCPLVGPPNAIHATSAVAVQEHSRLTPIVNAPLLPDGLADCRSVTAVNAHRVVDVGAVTLMVESEPQAWSDITPTPATNIRMRSVRPGRCLTPS